MFDLYEAVPIGIGVIVIAIVTLCVYFRMPFEAYPCHVVDIDVTGRRNVSMANEIEQYILDHGFREFQRQDVMVTRWRGDCVDKACNSPFREHRLRQYQRLDDSLAPFKFRLVRQHTRYRQHNYVKTPYVVTDVESEFVCSFDYLKERYHVLRAIGFETTTAKYFAKNQRNLMTPELRRRIKIRDHYTCQECGKYMPDEVGLHIDHIIPVSKGGKTVESNLQVLCDKCNLRKNNRVQIFAR